MKTALPYYLPPSWAFLLFLFAALFLLKQLNKTTTLITTGSRLLWRKNGLFAGEMLGIVTIKAHQTSHQSPLIVTIKAHQTSHQSPLIVTIKAHQTSHQSPLIVTIKAHQKEIEAK